MIRKIIIPTHSEYTLQIPKSFIGKSIEVLAFALPESEESKPKTKILQKIKGAFEGVRVDMTNYKFNRDEANDYEG